MQSEDWSNRQTRQGEWRSAGRTQSPLWSCRGGRKGGRRGEGQQWEGKRGAESGRRGGRRVVKWVIGGRGKGSKGLQEKREESGGVNCKIATS